MRLTFDPEGDCGCIAFGDIRAKKVARTINIELTSDGALRMLNVDVNAEDRVLGIEVIGVSRVMLGGRFPMSEGPATDGRR